jgi:5-methyltetrahydrofolate--homocysteine methyltransferase
MMKLLLDRLQATEILVADGAMGSFLFQRGLKSGKSPESMNLNHPDVLIEIADLYFKAGADIVQTNSFGGSPLKLAQYGLDNKTEEINRIAAQCVRQVVGENAYVSGSCGPTGKMLKPLGEIDIDEMQEGFQRQIKGLVEGGVDIICVETMTDLTEATLAIKAAKIIAPDLPVMATMTFDPTPRGFFTIMGVNIAQAVKELTEAGADVVGSNCGNGLEKMIEIAQEFRKSTKLPIIIQSNAGLPEMNKGKVEYPEDPAFFGKKVKDLIQAGVSIIGGCCGTTPAHIAAIKKAIKQAN